MAAPETALHHLAAVKTSRDEGQETDATPDYRRNGHVEVREMDEAPGGTQEPRT